MLHENPKKNPKKKTDINIFTVSIKLKLLMEEKKVSNYCIHFWYES